jgi:hypothetical protein
LKSVFLLVYHQNPSSKRRSIEKREREKVLKKEEGKKLKEFLQIKWRSQYFDRRKTF